MKKFFITLLCIGLVVGGFIGVKKYRAAKVEERRISINEIERASIDGCLKEVFASDIYHTISPIGKMSIGSRKIIINDNQIGKIAKRLYKNITAVQSGELRDNMGWTLRIV